MLVATIQPGHINAPSSHFEKLSEHQGSPVGSTERRRYRANGSLSQREAERRLAHGVASCGCEARRLYPADNAPRHRWPWQVREERDFESRRDSASDDRRRSAAERQKRCHARPKAGPQPSAVKKARDGWVRTKARSHTIVLRAAFGRSSRPRFRTSPVAPHPAAPDRAPNQTHALSTQSFH